MRDPSFPRCMQRLNARYFVVVFLLLVTISCAPATSQGTQTEKKSTTPVPSSQAEVASKCPASPKMEKKIIPSGYAGNTGDFTLFGKGAIWGVPDPEEAFPIDQGGGMKIVWYVGPLGENEVAQLRLTQLGAEEKIIQVAVNGNRGLEKISDTLVLDSRNGTHFYAPEPGWYVWGSVFEVNEPGCYRMDAQWPNGKWSAILTIVK